MDGHTTSYETLWKTDIRTDTLYEDYIDFSTKSGVKRRVTPIAFGKELKTLRRHAFDSRDRRAAGMVSAIKG